MAEERDKPSETTLDLLDVHLELLRNELGLESMPPGARAIVTQMAQTVANRTRQAEMAATECFRQEVLDLEATVRRLEADKYRQRTELEAKVRRLEAELEALRLGAD